MKGAVIVGVLLATSAVGGAWWWLGISSEDANGPVVRRYATVEMRPIASTVLATGIIRLRVGAEVRVGSQLSGIVEELNVTVGSKIDKGDVIARIDSRGLQARLKQAHAQIGVLEQEVRRAQVELARAREMGERELAPANDVEDRSLDLAEARARLEKARRDAAIVETDLQYAVIRSPITGTVASVSTQKGETVAASFNTPTFATIIAADQLQLVAMVDETDIGAVETGNRVAFTVEAYPTKEFEGTVQQIAPKGTIISGVVNFEVMIAIASPVAVLRPDMTANVSIRTAERQALVLPNDAVRRDGFERFVYLDRDGDLVRQPVNTGTRETGFTEIRQGLRAGDTVAIVIESADEKI